MNRTDKIGASLSRNPVQPNQSSNDLADILTRIERVLVLTQQRNDQRFRHLERIIAGSSEASQNTFSKELGKLNRRLKNIGPISSLETSLAR